VRGERRLQAEDFTYWFVHRAFGWSVVLQLVWTFDRPLRRDALVAINSRLGDGPLNRRVTRAGVPFARPTWGRSDTCPELIIDSVPIDSAHVETWAEAEMNSAPLDPERGRQWQLRGASTHQGGYVLSLTALHLVADGKAMVSAAGDAFAGRGEDVLTSTASAVGLRRRTHDLADSVTQIGSAAGGVLRALRAARRSGQQPEAAPSRPARPPIHERAPLARTSWSIVSVDSDVWAKVAGEHGGTPNSLFIAIISGLLRSSGYAPLGEPIKVGIPVSRRGDADDRGNATAGVSVILTDEPIPGGDLGGIRSRCKAAFSALGSGHRPAMIHLQPLMWLLPTRLIVKVISGGNGMPDAVTSNLGTFSTALAEVDGVQASGVAFRGIAQGVEAALPYRFGDGVQSWLLEYDGTTTFSVAAFDELHVTDRGQLGRLLSTELEAWGVPHRLW
jgi:hypothetical protein